MNPSVTSWAEVVASRFIPDVSSITLAFDPDRLLAEETVLGLLGEQGFEVLWYEDPVKFRYVFETQYRQGVEGGRRWNLIVALAATEEKAGRIPFDLLRDAGRAVLSLGDLFPDLNYPVIETLEPTDLGALHEAVEAYRPSPLGELQTKDFVLKHVFEVAPELIKRPSDLLRFLARRHYRGLRLPPLLDQYIIDTVRVRGLFTDWPLESILPDRQAFFAFLQERWPIYLDRVAESKGIELGERGGGGHLAFAVPGPEDLPFGHDDVHVYIDDLFYAGFLKPVGHPLGERVSGEWMAAGVIGTTTAARAKNLDLLLDHTRMHMPEEGARHSDWLSFALGWAETVVERWHPDTVVSSELAGEFERLTAALDERFTVWVLERYRGLHNLASVDPVMVHHVPRILADDYLRAGHDKVALVVVDGMAIDQWLLVREVLADQLPNLDTTTTATFAWAPTLTSVSRQALFSGEVPQYFPGSILSTAKEASLWTAFWTSQGLSADQVGFEKGLGEAGSEQKLARLLAQPKLRALGLVVNAVDNIMHGAILGTEGVHTLVRQWAKQGHFSHLLGALLDEGFHVFITADHGNIEACGIGNPFEKALADLRGERVRVYPNATLRDKVHGEFASAIVWDPVGLPPGFVPLIASGRDAFITPGKSTVTHGGVALEELIVPFVRVTKG